MPCSQAEKDDALLSVISQNPKLPTIVYVTQQNSAERIAKLLAEQGVKAAAYHAGLDSETRERIQQDFMSGQTDCIAATIAFGMLSLIHI